MNINKWLASGAALVAAGMVPVAASAAQGVLGQEVSGQASYATQLSETDALSLPGFYDGTLRLTASPNGIVSGWYMEQYGQFEPVSGSEKNGRYRLTIGNWDFQVNAVRRADGTIVGTATQFSQLALYPRTFDFVARPSTS